MKIGAWSSFSSSKSVNLFLFTDHDHNSFSAAASGAAADLGAVSALREVGQWVLA
jgi:hypothetical protein